MGWRRRRGHLSHGPPRGEAGHLRDRRPRGAGARGHDARGRRQARRRRDPLLLLRAEARPAGGRLPHVPGRDRGHPEAADLLLHAGARRHGGDHHLGPREARPERGRRVPARQPPARLPGVRQGRRVPAPGHLVRLGRRALALHRAQAPLQEAARALAAGGDRPRALHPLLPLRALLPGGGRGQPARVPRARRPHLRRHPRRPSVRGAVQRQHHRALPGGRAHLHQRTASARGPGTSRTPARCARSAPRSATCTLTIRDDAKVVRVLGRDNHEVDDGWLCDKGRFGYQSFSAEERITAPMVRDGGYLREVSWERALSEADRGAEEGRRGHRRLRERADHQRGGLPRAAPDARRARLRTGRLARRAAPDPGTGAPARPSRPHRARVRHRPRGRDPRGGHRAGGRGADPRPARAQGRAPQRRPARDALGRPSTLDANAAAAVRFAPGAEEAALGALAAALGSPRAPARSRTWPGAPAPAPASARAPPARTAGPPSPADAVRAAAGVLRDAGDVVVLWGERLWAAERGAPDRRRAAGAGRRARPPGHGPSPG